MPACWTTRYRVIAIGVFLGAGTSDLIRNEQYQHTAACRGIAHARPSEAWNHFSSTSVDVIAGRFGLEGPRACVVAACASSTIAIGQAADAVRSGRVGCRRRAAAPMRSRG